MNKNKGIIGIGLIIAIVLGIAVVGGGAYYLSKSGKVNDIGNLDSKENLIQEVKTNSTSNNLSFYKNDNLSFYYPSNWKIETLGTKNDKNIQIILDPIKVFTPQEIKGLDVSMGMITFSVNNDSTEKNSWTGGYESFSTVTIGTNQIEAKTFEKFYPKSAPEVPLQGKHEINYYIGENIEISYRSEKDTYLKDFNQLINSLELNKSSEESLTEVFKNQPGAIKSIKADGVNKWILAVDLLSGNSNWVPGENEFFINQNTKIRNLNVTANTKTYNCAGTGRPDLLVNTSNYVSNIQDKINKAKTDPGLVGHFGYTAYFDINGTNITAIYERCLP